MAEQETKRIKVSALLDANLPHKEVARVAGVSISTMEHVAEAKRAGKGTKRKAGSGTTCWVSTKAFLEDLLTRITNNPKVSLRQHARELEVSLDTIQQAVAELGFKSFVRRKVQLITESARDRRLARAKKLLSWMKSSRAVSTVRIFSDKKIFTVDQFHNRHNDRWLAVNKDDVEFICTKSTHSR